MAGTSPDRSKRYESSTESTPGNEPPVPDAGALPGQSSGSTAPSQDPRVAMSRDRSPKPDQATAVFSRRALLEAADAEGLKRDTEDPEGTGNEAADTAGSGAAASGAGGSGPTGGSTTAGSKAGGSKAGGSGAGGSGAAGSEAGGSKLAGPKTVILRTSGSEDGGSETAGAASDEPEADAEDTGVADTGAADTGAADAEGSDAAGADAGSDAGSGGGDGPDEAPEGPAEAQADTDDAEDEPSADVDQAADTEPEAGAGAEAEGGDAGPRRERSAAGEDASPETDDGKAAASTGATADADVDAEPSAETGDGKAAASSDADAYADAAGTEGNADPDAAATGPVGDADPHARADDGKPAASDADAAAGGPAAGPEAEAEADPQARDGKVAASSGADAAAAGPEAEADPHARDGKAAARSDADAAGQDADADADAAGPEAEAAVDGDDASGSSAGRGDSGSAESDAAESAVAPHVDQPTAIFRAPRPPAVDQPTTMLKLGGAAAKPVDDADEEAPEGDKATPEPPVERTSKFVALKPLDEPAPAKAPAADADAPAISPAEATRAIPQVGPERTTQQPLPPKPPLDLLAELTNTPPPRQTPVRTIIRRVKIWTPLAILLVIVFAIAQAVRPLPTPTLALTAEESYAFEGDKVSLPWPDEGQGWMDVNGIGTMDSFGEQKPVAIGSVAKAMTAYVILKEHPMKPGSKGETIPVDAKAETEGGYDKDGESTLNTVKEGDQLSQYDAIAAIMIPSANNIARLLARWDSNGSEEEFVKKMNAAAKDLGMKNTTYTDPSGLKETTVSTAEDQVKLGNELVRMKALTDITRLPEWKDPSGLKHRNYNTLVPYNNAIGIKTGSTTAAGGNLLFAGTKEVGGETAIVVGAILGQHTPPIIDTVNAVSKTAMLAAQDALTSNTVLKKGAVVGYVDDGLGGQAPVVATKDVSAVGWAGKTVRLELDASEAVPHEAKAGTKVGSLIVGDGFGEGVEVPVALQNDLTEPGFGARLTRVS
ncbi:D-alanyl-D-alanine carboxypeptidase [Streptomyces sp. NPDC002787]